MAKIVNITDKLSFEENPKIQIKNKIFEVNADAKTMLEIMGDFQSKGDTEAALSAYERLLNENDRKEIDDMNLSFKDLMVIIKTAVNLANGAEDDEEGEE